MALDTRELTRVSSFSAVGSPVRAIREMRETASRPATADAAQSRIRKQAKQQRKAAAIEATVVCSAAWWDKVHAKAERARRRRERDAEAAATAATTGSRAALSRRIRGAPHLTSLRSDAAVDDRNHLTLWWLKVPQTATCSKELLRVE